MDYEKKYKETLALARDYYKANLKLNKADENLILEDIFPELKESEDEKIRKKIIEYMKNGTYNKDYIRYADKYSYEIWRKLMDNFKNIKDYHIGCNEVSDIVLNAIIDTFKWLEKGGDKNKVSKHVEAINEEKVDDAINEEKVDDANKVEPKDYNSIDPHFGKPVDKVEPKFKIEKDKWYVCTQTFVLRGKEVIIKGQTYQAEKDNVIKGEYGCRFIDRHDGKASDYLRSWTIRDAKDGDVLCYETENELRFFIYKNGHIHYHFYYCNEHLISIDSFFVVQKHLLCYIHPATKEQRDTLFAKMHEAGYDWDAEKKELKKIKFNPDDLIEESYQQQADDLIDMVTEKPAWSDEDERNIQNIDAVLFYDRKLPEDTCVKLRNFLKTLKQRIGG